MSRERSKKILGLFSVLIMLHHLGQKVSAPWVPELYRQHGLELFVPIGYLLVSFFFFCSGYGLIKSAKSRDDYFDDFLIRRLNRILFVFAVTQLIYFAVRTFQKAVSLPLNPYSWFIYTIIVLYVGFFLIYRKESKLSLTFMILWILAYSIICYILVKGNWWYNASPVFLLGIFMAQREMNNRNNDHFRLLPLILSCIIFLICFIVPENADTIYRSIHMQNYGIMNLIRVLLQIIACSAFSLVIYLLASRPHKDNGNETDTENEATKKGRIASSILSFYGSMTLEFYLIHGLFVQLFGHHFMSDTKPPVYYIRNIALYVLVVLAFSTASAFSLKKLTDWMAAVYKNSDSFRKFSHDMKRAGLIVLLVVAGITVFMGLNRTRVTREAEKPAEEFKNNYVKTIMAGGREIAVLDEGIGEHTIVLMSCELPCATLHLKPLADRLSTDYRVIVIDYPGTGFSSNTDGERNVDFYTDIVKDTLEALDIRDHIILAPHLLSSLYGISYAAQYPEGLEGIVFIDGVPPEVGKHVLDGNFSSEDEYAWFIRRYTGAMKLQQELMVRTGYVAIQLPLYEFMYPEKKMQEYLPVMEMMYTKDYMQGAYLLEQKEAYANCEKVINCKLPKDLPAVFLLSNQMRVTNPYGINWVKAYDKRITDKDTQKVKIITGDPYDVYYNPKVIKNMIDEFVADQKGK
ncbi:MAG: acyltransferase family protein [Lachnospiraceae bacterium]|nr:acyltransferase family protein [Lachnospiraceae bacterium]